MQSSTPFKIGISSIGANLTDPVTHRKMTQQQRIQQLIAMAIQAEVEGLDSYALGESHQAEFVSAAHTVILGAIAQATQQITLMSSVTVLSTLEPVRIFEDFATLDLISNGRIELVAGRGSRVGGFHLLGYAIEDYEALFEEKMALLNAINQATAADQALYWQGKFRPPLNNVKLFPQPLQGKLKIWQAVGGQSHSAISAAQRGLPMVLTTLAGDSLRFKTVIDRYRETLRATGEFPDSLPITTTSWFYTADTDQQAVEEFYPYFNGMLQELRSESVPLSFLEDSLAIDNAMMIGSAATIVAKLKYQYLLYKQQHFLAHVDTGALPEALIQRNIHILATVIAPEIRAFVASHSNKS